MKREVNITFGVAVCARYIKMQRDGPIRNIGHVPVDEIIIFNGLVALRKCGPVIWIVPEAEFKLP